jgi:hypothetical protein
MSILDHSRKKARRARAQAQRPSDRDGKDASGRTGYEIIVEFLREKYDPVFRRDAKIYSRKFGRLISESEACYGAPIALVDRLTAAVDAPHFRGDPDRDKMPYFFRTWIKSAWVDIRDSLPEEEECDEITPSAEEQFRAKVSAALFHLEAVQYRHKGGQEADVQRRSLISFCRAFAVTPNWAEVRPYTDLLWTRKGADGRPQVALRKDLFAQVPRCADLARLSQKAFSTQCQNYGVGVATKAGGYRVVALTPEFIAELLARPVDECVDECVDESTLHTRARGMPNLSTETSTNGFHCRRKGEREPGEDDE